MTTSTEDLKEKMQTLMDTTIAFEREFKKDSDATMLLWSVGDLVPEVQNVQSFINRSDQGGKEILQMLIAGTTKRRPAEVVLTISRVFRKLMKRGEGEPRGPVRELEGNEEGLIVTGRNMWGEWWSLWVKSGKAGEDYGEAEWIEFDRSVQMLDLDAPKGEKGKVERDLFMDPVVWAEVKCN